ncbi:UDP-N-acetylmuramoyl-L-alanine--D-glutamate ligase [Candidatus Parcubacteria bacterium]|nr:UDP-N-acetylmuramoyl-L-alanine--D-glutamate ligase [Candidatus Parcubacteria bacterium]
MSISEKLNQYKNKNIHIVGIGGAEGSAVAEFLVANGISSITGHDFSPKADFKKVYYNTHLSLKSKKKEEDLNHLLNLPIRINFKDHYLEGVEEADIVFVSQVWFKYPQNMPILEKLKDSGVPFKTITNLYFELAPCKIISVTGTNGKTTTVRLINNIFEAWTETPQPSLSGGLNSPPDKEGWGIKVYFAGNDRQNVQVLDKLSEMTKDDVLILETSSTQLLLNSGISPRIGVITNITSNHIDDHGSFENYIEAKKNLIRYQKKGDWTVLNYDNQETRKIANESKIKNQKSKIFLFSRKEKLKEGCFVKDGKIVMKIKEAKRFIGRLASEFVTICNIDNIKIPGKHNLENVLAAVSVAYLYGIEPRIIKKGVSEYTGTKHRLKLLYNIDGIKYYDDTQATTPEAAIAGLESFDKDIILLAGGDNKRMDYQKLVEKINDKVKFLVLFPGDASDEIGKLINKNKIDFIKVKNFQEAIKILKKYYKKTGLSKGSVVLISPGAAHFYSKYVENTNKDLREWVKLMK